MAFTGGSEAYKLDVGIYRKGTETGSRAKTGNGSRRAEKPKVIRQMAECAAFSLILLAFGVLYLSAHANMALLGSRLGAEQRKLHELSARNDYLQLQLMRLQSLRRVEDIARGRAGMVEPDEGRAIALRAGEASGSATVPRGSSVRTVVLDAQELAQPAHMGAQ